MQLKNVPSTNVGAKTQKYLRNLNDLRLRRDKAKTQEVQKPPKMVDRVESRNLEPIIVQEHVKQTNQKRNQYRAVVSNHATKLTRNWSAGLTTPRQSQGRR